MNCEQCTKELFADQIVVLVAAAACMFALGYSFGEMAVKSDMPICQPASIKRPAFVPMILKVDRTARHEREAKFENCMNVCREKCK